MACTVVPDGYAHNAYELNAHVAQNLKIVYGSFDFAATYPNGGATFTISQLATVKGCITEPANGYVYRYVSGVMKAYYQAAAVSLTTVHALSEVATDTSMATCSAITFFAWGY